MGFGLLFIGYFLHYLLGLNQLITFTTLAGCAMMYAGLSVLSLYCHTFRFARYTTLAIALTAFYRTAQGLTELFSFTLPFVNDTVSYCVSFAELLLTVVFHVFLAIAIKEICMRTGVQKNAVHALTNMVAVLLYAVMWVWYSGVAQVTHMVSFNPTARSYSGVLYGLTMLMKLVWIIGNLILIGSCYRRICPAGQEDASRPVKPSRFAFVNDMREKYRKSEEKARREDLAYRQEKLDQKMGKSANGQHKSRAAKRAEIQAARDAARRRKEDE
jgi:hypothetical protein